MFKGNNLPEDVCPDFLLHIKFQPGVSDPQRIFNAVADCIGTLHEWDGILLRSFRADIKPVFVLELVESGSLKVWLRQIVDAIDDDALKMLDWKPAVGKYLVKGKHIILKMLDGKKELGERRDLARVSSELHQLARETDVLRFPAYAKIPEADIAESVKKLSEALSILKQGESMTYADEDGEATVDSELAVTDKSIRDLLTANTIENTSNIILMVKKPDFLGDSKWEFRFNKRSMSVAVTDRDWLAGFQNGELDIRPGDALHVSLLERVGYDPHGEVVSEDREIVKVIDIIKRIEQESLI